jgi:hypothetical protein
MLSATKIPISHLLIITTTLSNGKIRIRDKSELACGCKDPFSNSQSFSTSVQMNDAQLENMAGKFTPYLQGLVLAANFNDHHFRCERLSYRNAYGCYGARGKRVS